MDKKPESLDAQEIAHFAPHATAEFRFKDQELRTHQGASLLYKATIGAARALDIIHRLC
jgi:hypothetical protein